VCLALAGLVLEYSDGYIEYISPLDQSFKVLPGRSLGFTMIDLLSLEQPSSNGSFQYPTHGLSSFEGSSHYLSSDKALKIAHKLLLHAFSPCVCYHCSHSTFIQ
jgi:hypothetical protein